MTISAEHLAELETAKRLLEHPGFITRLVDWLGLPIQQLTRFLPEPWRGQIHQATGVALRKALRVAVVSLGEARSRPAAAALHRLSAAASGALGGVLGLPALIVELPVTTVLMLRSIADIARANGEDIRSTEAQLECMQVFALGGKSGADDAMESSYFLVRAALARETAQAAEYIAKNGLVEGGPAIVRLLAAVSSRFGIVVSEKAAVQAVPVFGALSGAAINTFFMRHFQDLAWGHFTVRRLERLYGPEEVARQYSELDVVHSV